MPLTSLYFLSSQFCNTIRQIVREVARISSTRPETHLATRPINLDMIGLSWLNDLVFHLIVQPLTRHLYMKSECADCPLDWRHGYVAGYSAQASAETATPRNRLVLHTDDSEVTLNVGLGDLFEGGELEFHGLRGNENYVGSYSPILGKAVLHAGRHLHQVSTVTHGDRYAFIMWARSWTGIRSESCPCCWLNRRIDYYCICGPAWN